eukprot:CAMPEP_0172887370 /NCGR_PEP_ID=MMETSP1075-20121228/133730_1 /TAXON_ID=2916 /ORGANISM="Ceratium fusus, Strain PA161109" /LENGTH=147 /DNA_ID=CAMNT_0013741039 /DNA_START=209 /DNA_END=652 /DNA_ORIENTATION=+
MNSRWVTRSQTASVCNAGKGIRNIHAAATGWVPLLLLNNGETLACAQHMTKPLGERAAGDPAGAGGTGGAGSAARVMATMVATDAGVSVLAVANCVVGNILMMKLGPAAAVLSGVNRPLRNPLGDSTEQQRRTKRAVDTTSQTNQNL